MLEEIRLDVRLSALPALAAFREVAKRRRVLRAWHVEWLLTGRVQPRFPEPEQAGPSPEDILAFHSSAIRLELSQLRFVVPGCLLLLLSHVVAPGYSIPRLVLDGLSVLWILSILLKWIHLSRIDPSDYWRKECGTEVRRVDPELRDDRSSPADAHAGGKSVTPLVEARNDSPDPSGSVEGAPRAQLAAHWFAQGIAAQSGGRDREAVDLLRRAANAAPLDLRLKGGLAMGLVVASCRMSDPAMGDEGFRLFEEVLAVQRDPITLFNYAQALRMTLRNAEAILVTEELRQITPDDPYLLEIIKELRKPPTIH